MGGFLICGPTDAVSEVPRSSETKSVPGYLQPVGTPDEPLKEFPLSSKRLLAKVALTRCSSHRSSRNGPPSALMEVKTSVRKDIWTFGHVLTEGTWTFQVVCERTC